jgi:type III restriction enzyme
VELKDGRMVVVEYKGQHLRAEPYEIEKRAVGQLWARKSASKCRFEFVFKKGDNGVSLAVQLDALLNP